MDSPVGQLKLVARGERLAAILWENDKPNRVRLGEVTPDDDRPILREAERQLNEYFAGKRQTFDLALDFQGTEFQKKVWAALLTIPFGQTRSYAQIAAQIGNINAVRAVGAANGRNPISIVAPCHRVIGASGELTGFAGGLANKMLLLSLEAGQTSLEAGVERRTPAVKDPVKDPVKGPVKEPTKETVKPADKADKANKRPRPAPAPAPARELQTSLFDD
jgi:methylated-DNA-[protein]-cysteine S-methyltransferase